MENTPEKTKTTATFDHLEALHHKVIKLRELNIEYKLHLNYEHEAVPKIFRKGTKDPYK